MGGFFCVASLKVRGPPLHSAVRQRAALPVGIRDRAEAGEANPSSGVFVRTGRGQSMATATIGDHMTRKVLMGIGLGLFLTGCTVPPSPGQADSALTNPIISNNPGPDYRTVMTNIGIDYAAELSWHDPQRVISAIDLCYKDSVAFPGIKGQSDTRRCLAMDYAAYKDNQIATHNYRTPGIPYFSEDAAARRWAIYGPQAGFTTADAMFQFMRGTYAFVHPAQVNVTRSRTPGTARIPPTAFMPTP